MTGIVGRTFVPRQPPVRPPAPVLSDVASMVAGLTSDELRALADDMDAMPHPPGHPWLMTGRMSVELAARVRARRRESGQHPALGALHRRAAS